MAWVGAVVEQGDEDGVGELVGEVGRGVAVEEDATRWRAAARRTHLGRGERHLRLRVVECGDRHGVGAGPTPAHGAGRRQ